AAQSSGPPAARPRINHPEPGECERRAAMEPFLRLPRWLCKPLGGPAPRVTLLGSVGEAQVLPFVRNVHGPADGERGLAVPHTVAGGLLRASTPLSPAR